MINWRNLLAWAVDRADEPSTYAGIGALLVAANVHVDPSVLAKAMQAGIALAGLLGVVLSEKKADRNQPCTVHPLQQRERPPGDLVPCRRRRGRSCRDLAKMPQQAVGV